MGRQIKSTGKTVDEAIWNGINELGLSLDEVEIETIQKGSTGLLGIGSKPAIVLLTEKDEDTIDIKSLLNNDSAENKTEAKAKNKPDSARKDSPAAKVMSVDTVCEKTSPIPVSKPTPTAKVNNPAPKTQENIKTTNSCADKNIAYEKKEIEKKRVDTEAANNTPKAASQCCIKENCNVNYSTELAKSNDTALFLSDLLKHMDIEAEVLAAEVDDSLKLKINSESAGVLIGHRGESLDAIQYLTLLFANKNRGQKEYVRVSVDAQDYREKREETLIRLAKAKASAVRANGRPYRFEPMNPYERRIIHSTLQSNSQVTTHSEGEEPHRYVVITANRAPRNRYHKPHRKDSNESINASAICESENK